MLISETHKFVFTHIPRTGGASIRATLSPYGKSKKGTIHLPMSGALASKYTDYHKFCVVRNPWARYASLYKFQLSRGEIDPGFDQYIYNIVQSIARFKFYHWNQLRFGLQYMDRVINHNQLESEFRLLCMDLGLPEIPLPHHHNEGDYNYQTMYTPHTRAMIAAHCKKEIRLYRWKF